MNIRNLNGVGLVASRARAIKPGYEFDAYFPKPERTDPILSYNAENEQTLEKYLPEVIKKYQGDTVKIAVLLKGKTLEDTLRKIWQFCYDYIQYRLDDPHEEQIRAPRRTWSDRQRGVDCDCYTAFISTILCNMGVVHALRMAAYSKDRGFQHVYVVVPKTATSSLNKKGDYITIDPVLEAFDNEKPFLNKKDRMMMSGTNGLSGFAVRNLNGLGAVTSNLVYPEVYYSPGLRTWALKGLDGAYYLRGVARYTEPLSGPGVGFIPTGVGVGGFFKKLGKFAGKVAGNVLKPIAATAMNAFVPGSGTLLNALTSGGGGGGKGVVSQVAEAMPNMMNRIAPEGSITSAALNTLTPGTMSQTRLLPGNGGGGSTVDNSALEGKIKASNSSTVASISNTKSELQKDIKASNKAVVTSLDSVNRQFATKMDAISANVTAELAKVQKQSGDLAQLTKQVQTIVAQTQLVTRDSQATAEQGNAAILQQLDQVQDTSEKSDKTKKTVMWVAIAATAAFVIYFVAKKSKTF